MPNHPRPDVAREPKEALAILDANPHAWWAIHTALVSAARCVARGETDLLDIARRAVVRAADTGFGQGQDDERITRFTGLPIMAWQDALYVVNELPEWRFPDEVLLVAWLVECGGPGMGRGPARAAFEAHAPAHYVGATRGLYNDGKHGNGPGWPPSREWRRQECRYMAGR